MIYLQSDYLLRKEWKYYQNSVHLTYHLDYQALISARPDGGGMRGRDAAAELH
jgi:hypothetical protein